MCKINQLSQAQEDRCDQVPQVGSGGDGDDVGQETAPHDVGMIGPQVAVVTSDGGVGVGGAGGPPETNIEMNGGEAVAALGGGDGMELDGAESGDWGGGATTL